MTQRRAKLLVHYRRRWKRKWKSHFVQWRIKKTGIYYLGSSWGNGSFAAEDSLIKMRVDWNGTAEVVELRPEVN